jgi:hypothetical protein
MHNLQQSYGYIYTVMHSLKSSLNYYYQIMYGEPFGTLLEGSAVPVMK